MHQSDSQPCACTMLRKASRAVTRLYDDRLAGHGLTVTQFAILRNLARAGELPLNQLAERLVMDRTSLYRTIAPIERQGWVAIDPMDGRTKRARLTDAGRAVMDGAEEDWASAQQRMLDSMGANDWQLLQKALGGLIAAAQP